MVAPATRQTTGWLDWPTDETLEPDDDLIATFDDGLLAADGFEDDLFLMD